MYFLMLIKIITLLTKDYNWETVKDKPSLRMNFKRKEYDLLKH